MNISRQKKIELGRRICEWWKHQEHHRIECTELKTDVGLRASYSLIIDFDISEETLKKYGDAYTRPLTSGMVIATVNFSCNDMNITREKNDDAFYVYIAEYIAMQLFSDIADKSHYGSSGVAKHFDALKSSSYEELEVKLDLAGV